MFKINFTLSETKFTKKGEEKKNGNYSQFKDNKENKKYHVI